MADGGDAQGNATQVIPEDVRALGNFAYQLAQDVQDALGSANHDVTALTNSGWLGDAGNAFGHGWSECHDGGKEVFAALIEMAKELGVTAETYNAQDSQTAQDVASLNQYQVNI